MTRQAKAVAVEADAQLREVAGPAWDNIREALADYRNFRDRYAFTEGGQAFRSRLFGFAKTLVRRAAESTKPDEERLPEFTALLAAANELRPKIKAGVLVSGRRWDLVMTNGIIVKLPEINAPSAMATLVRLQREEGRKLVVSSELTQGGRLLADAEALFVVLKPGSP